MNEELFEWNDLAKDVLIIIFSSLSAKDILTVRLVNKHWNKTSYCQGVFSRKEWNDLIVTCAADSTLKIWREEENSSSKIWKEVIELVGHSDYVKFFF